MENGTDLEKSRGPRSYIRFVAQIKIDFFLFFYIFNIYIFK